jgi:hypothetical protein
VKDSVGRAFVLAVLVCIVGMLLAQAWNMYGRR